VCGIDPGLLAEFPDRGVQIGLAGLYAAAGQFLPGPEFGVVDVVRVEEQQPALDVEHDDPYRAAFNDWQVVRQRHAYPIWRSAGVPRMAMPSMANPAMNMTTMAGHCRALGR
jgi:hypothetical protein